MLLYLLSKPFIIFVSHFGGFKPMCYLLTETYIIVFICNFLGVKSCFIC